MISISSVVRTSFLLVITVSLAVLVIISPPRHKASDRRSALLGPLASSPGFVTKEWIRIQGGLIESIAPSMRVENPRTSIGEGLYATPGLVDMHVHFPPNALPGHVDLFNLLLLTHGITSVREMGTIGTNIPELEREVESGTRAGPRIFSCGTPLTGSPPSAPFAESVEVDTDVKRIIRQNAAGGADCIKLYRGFPESLVEIASEEAALYGLPLVGHLPARAQWGGDRVTDIQHLCDPRCARLGNSAIEALIRTARDRLVRHTPTLVAFYGPLVAQTGESILGLELMPRIWRDLFWAPETLRTLGFSALGDSRSYGRMHERVMDAAKGLVEAGALMQTGSDAPHPFVVPGASLHQEMRLLHQLGFSVGEVWQAATATPGDFLPTEGIGTLVPGAPADILLFREDPYANLDALSSLEIVIANGRVYQINDLRQRLQDQIDYINGPLYEYAIEPALRFGLGLAAEHPSWFPFANQ